MESSSSAPQPVADDLTRRTIERRAIEAVIWGMPVVNYDLMLQEMLTRTTGKVNQVVYWGRPLDSRNQTLTPNPDALYFMAFFNTKDGPIVLDLPPGDANGSFNGTRAPAPLPSRSSPPDRAPYQEPGLGPEAGRLGSLAYGVPHSE